MARPIPHWHTCSCESTWRCERPHCDLDGTCGECEQAQRSAWLTRNFGPFQDRLTFGDEDAPETAQEHTR